MKFLNEAIPSTSSTTLTTWDPEFGRKVVRMTITQHCPKDLVAAVRVGLGHVRALTTLDWDLVDKG